MKLQTGFTIVTAVFILVVLALLGSAMVNLSTQQHTAAALDVQGARAYQAARSGAEWGAYQALRASSCAASTTLTLTGSLSPFTVLVTCSVSSTDEAGVTVNVYQITATACTDSTCPSAAPGPSYVERRVQLTVGG